VTGVVTSRGRVVVLDENEATRVFVRAAFESAGYEVFAVATTLGLRKALAPERPTVVVCDVSPPLTHPQVVAAIRAVKGVTEGRMPVVLCGSQTADQLSVLVRACHVEGFIERREDPVVLLKQMEAFVGTPRRSISSELEIARCSPQWTVVKLLLIDDSEITLQLMQERARQGGFDVRIALSLSEVRSIIHGWSPNVIVADVNMPEMRGDDLCARLKIEAATRDAIVLLCSSMSEERLATIADAAGADGFVSKSLGLDHFASTIEAMCGRISNPQVTFE
jgi:CheY-like chemotaxis protein